jgi:hypothetical protein
MAAAWSRHRTRAGTASVRNGYVPRRFHRELEWYLGSGRSGLAELVLGGAFVHLRRQR